MPSKKKWEYRILEYVGPLEEREAFLNREARQGWELVAVDAANRMYLKRPKAN